MYIWYLRIYLCVGVGARRERGEGGREGERDRAGRHKTNHRRLKKVGNYIACFAL